MERVVKGLSERKIKQLTQKGRTAIMFRGVVIVLTRKEKSYRLQKKVLKLQAKLRELKAQMKEARR